MATGSKSAQRMRRMRALRREKGYREFSVLVSPANVTKVEWLAPKIGVSPTAALEALLQQCCDSFKIPTRSADENALIAPVLEALERFRVSPKSSTKTAPKRKHK